MGLMTTTRPARSSAAQWRRRYATPEEFILSEDCVPAALEALAEGAREAIAESKRRAKGAAGRK
jgi:hypothetical protein